ncbi:EAL domain-containing protein [Alkalimonas amylolytica]|uniref:Diguanylate cyclase (GGDEF) domain-containing protein n=1 Tax=Alkalimonas amylolytica TaxID=152573 RepID=A0A1H3YIE1_ALKAM|nr:EAL domain-containing protein [Alkalimonas amylolytica]SEA11313.1 diguanylate cyclase (GGDEF) domain-containing protein [Alkalimonas amylolytica]
MIARIAVILFCMLFSCISQAHYAQSQVIDQQLEQLSLRDTLYFQITDDNVEVEDFLLNPALHHAFQLVKDQQKAQIEPGEVVWLFVRLRYTGEGSLNTIIHYDFPLADQVTKVLFDRQQHRLLQQYHTGSDYPFVERLLPYPSFAFPLILEPSQEIDVFLKIKDAGLVPLQLSLWQQEYFNAAQTQLSLIEGIIQGLLLALVLYNCYLLLRRQRLLYLYQAGCYLSLSLVIATLSGQAFAHLWPNQPEINSAILYVLSGLTLLCLNQFTYLALSSFQRLPWRWLFLVNQLLSLILLFSPLFADGQLRVLLLLVCSLTVLISNSFVSFAHFLQGHVTARFFALAWLCLLLCGGLLMVSGFGLLQLPLMWNHALLASLIVSMAFISYHFAHHQESADYTKYAGASPLNQQNFGHLFFQQSNEAIFVASANGQLVQANSRFYDITGLAPTAEQAARARLLLLETILPDWPLLYPKAIQQEDPVVMQLFGEHGVGALVAVTAEYVAMQGAEEKLICGKLKPLSEEAYAKLRQQQLNELDNLTGLLNQSSFVALLQQSLSANESGALLQIDLIDFKRINEQCEQAAGDALLRQVAAKLQQELTTLPLARLSADTFVAYLPNKGSQEAFIQSYRLLDELRGFRFIWQEHIFRIHISIGVLNMTPTDGDANQALQMVAQACQQAKNKGYNRIHMHQLDASDQALTHTEHSLWENKVREALNDNKFVLNLQYIQQESPSEKARYEILLRYKADAGHLIPAVNFMPAARKANLTERIDRWVIEHYFAWLYQHQAELNKTACSHLNISAASIADPDFINFISDRLRHYQLNANTICFEIDEYVAVEFLSGTVSFINQARELGCLICLDNFGSGLSTFSLLKHLPLDHLKIDANIMRKLTSEPLNMAIVRCIVDMAKSMGIEPIAPYIETEETYQLMKDYGVRFFQGYHLSKPCLLTEAYQQLG